MTKPPSLVTVTTEVGYCPFCRRSRTLRREERHLGGLVRTNIDCESCHRTISSTMGVPQPKAEEAAPAEPAAPTEPEAAPEPAPKPKPAARAAASKAAPRKTPAARKTRA